MPVSAMRRQFPTVNLMLSAVKRREVRIWRASTGLPRREREGRFSQLCEKPGQTDGQKDTLGGCILRILSVPPPFPLPTPTLGGVWLGGEFSILRELAVKEGLYYELVVLKGLSPVPIHRNQRKTQHSCVSPLVCPGLQPRHPQAEVTNGCSCNRGG